MAPKRRVEKLRSWETRVLFRQLTYHCWRPATAEFSIGQSGTHRPGLGVTGDDRRRPRTSDIAWSKLRNRPEYSKENKHKKWWKLARQKLKIAKAKTFLQSLKGGLNFDQSKIVYVSVTSARSQRPWCDRKLFEASNIAFIWTLEATIISG